MVSIYYYTHMSKKSLEIAASTVNDSKRISSKFGVESLKKMGWKEGEGLGKHKQGDLEPIPIVRRKTNLGLGATKKYHNWWDDLFNDTIRNFKEVKPKKKVKISS